MKNQDILFSGNWLTKNYGFGPIEIGIIRLRDYSIDIGGLSGYYLAINSWWV